MNSFTNSILLFFSILLIGFCIYVGFDIQIDFLHSSGSNLPYQSYVYLGFGILFFGLLGWRSVRRWMGIYIVNKTTRFTWNKPTSKKSLQKHNKCLESTKPRIDANEKEHVTNWQ